MFKNSQPPGIPFFADLGTGAEFRVLIIAEGEFRQPSFIGFPQGGNCEMRNPGLAF